MSGQVKRFEKDFGMMPESTIREDTYVIDINHILSAILRRWRLVLLVVPIFVLAGGFIAFCVFEQKYRSVGTLLFNPRDFSNVITNIQSNNHFLKGEGIESSPFKTQEELLRSNLIAQRVFDTLERAKVPVPVKSSSALLKQKILEATQVPNTDVIRVSAKAASPDIAQKIASVYLHSYLDLMHEICYEPLIEQKKLFSQQVTQAEHNLQKTNFRLQSYQQQYGIIDIDNESQARVDELVKMDMELNNSEAGLTQKQAEVSRIRNQLGLHQHDLNTAIRAVANGQDALLNSLREKVNDLQKDYNAKAIVYSATNPEMRQLQEQIDTLEKQIREQQIATTAHAVSGKDSVIKDSVRTELVSRLAAAETDAAALSRKMGTIRRQYGQLKLQLSRFPQQQIEYARLNLEQHNQEELLTKLRQKLSEVQIQEASFQKNLKIIDEPDFPQDPLFPHRKHIILLAGLSGLMLSLLYIVWQAALGSRQLMPDYVEQALGLPVLSVIPWLPERQWQHYRCSGLLEVSVSRPDSRILNAYQNLALNLKVQGRKADGQNTLVVASLLKESSQSFVLANLGFCLAQSGQQVLLVDTNLRQPCLHKPFNHTLDYDKGLLELINGVSERLYLNPQSKPSDLTQLVKWVAMPSGIHPQLHYLNAGSTLENTFEFLNSKGFYNLIHVLKSGYDWVLLSAPPFLKYPDSAVLLSATDGLLLLLERDATESQVMAVQKQVEHLNSKIWGTVLRSPLP